MCLATAHSLVCMCVCMIRLFRDEKPRMLYELAVNVPLWHNFDTTRTNSCSSGCYTYVRNATPGNKVKLKCWLTCDEPIFVFVCIPARSLCFMVATAAVWRTVKNFANALGVGGRSGTRMSCMYCRESRTNIAFKWRLVASICINFVTPLEIYFLHNWSFNGIAIYYTVICKSSLYFFFLLCRYT